MKQNKTILTLPHPKLRQLSKAVRTPDPQTEKVVGFMEAATLSWEDKRKHEIAVALAAVQIGILKKVIIIRHSFKDKADDRFDVFLNPHITRHEGEPIRELEGCLSVKDMYVEVERYPRVKVKATALDGTPLKFVAKGFLARVLQHEIDHTEGITIVDRLPADGKICKIASNGNMEPLTTDQQIAFLDTMKQRSTMPVETQS